MFNRVKVLLKQIANSGNSHLAWLSRVEQALISDIRERNLTYLSERRLATLAHSCRSIEDRAIPGIFIEAGCALGGSIILLSKLKARKRPLYGYDVFGMIPAPTSDDTQDVHDRYTIIREGKSKGIGGDRYYGYEENLYDVIRTNLVSFGVDAEDYCVKLIRGLIQDTMKIDQPVALAHVDVDWYEPVMTCLERIIPHLAVGGVLILDDYRDWGGCRKATDKYFQEAPRHFLMDDSAGSMRITRTVG